MDHHHHSSKNILTALILNAVFTVVEFIGGYLTNSVAIYSDALHDLGDTLALIFAYMAEKMGHKDPDQEFTFGYRRFSILSAFLNGLMLIVGSIYIIYEAVQRILAPEPVMAEGMIGLAILGIVVNGIAAYRLSKDDGLNVKMVMHHLLEDVLGWVGVLIVSIVLFFKPWFILDSILSIIIALIILRGVYRSMMQVGMILLQKFPDAVDIAKIKDEVTQLENVVDIHEVKGWSVDGVQHILNFHVTVPAGTTIESIDIIKKQIKEILKDYKVGYSSIQFEGQK
jgi:cobalt-zinc-cadmium efflux system protein